MGNHPRPSLMMSQCPTVLRCPSWTALPSPALSLRYETVAQPRVCLGQLWSVGRSESIEIVMARTVLQVVQ